MFFLQRAKEFRLASTLGLNGGQCWAVVLCEPDSTNSSTSSNSPGEPCVGGVVMKLSVQSKFTRGILRFALGWPVLAIFVLLAASVRDARANLRISEFAAGNGTGLRD